MRPPNRKQEQNTQCATAGSKNKNKNTLQCSILTPESIGLVEVREATVQAASTFSSVLSVPGPRTP